MNENDVYLAKLSKELKRHSVSTSEMQHTLARVQETLEHSGSTPVEEFGTPETYVRALYPDREQQKYYLFTLVGLFWEPQDSLCYMYISTIRVCKRQWKPYGNSLLCLPSRSGCWLILLDT